MGDINVPFWAPSHATFCTVFFSSTKVFQWWLISIFNVVYLLGRYIIQVPVRPLPCVFQTQCVFAHACLRAQSRPTLCDLMDCSLPGSSVHGTFQVRIMEQVSSSSFTACVFLTPYLYLQPQLPLLNSLSVSSNSACPYLTPYLYLQSSSFWVPCLSKWHHLPLRSLNWTLLRPLFPQ